MIPCIVLILYWERCFLSHLGFSWWFCLRQGLAMYPASNTLCSPAHFALCCLSLLRASITGVHSTLSLLILVPLSMLSDTVSLFLFLTLLW